MLNETVFKNLFILEMANNHMGDIEHGLKLINEFHEVCKDFNFKFAFKFQYRDIETFIHPEYRNRTDVKYVKRFTETRLTEAQQLALKEEAQKLNFMTICTPFDEKSVDLVENHGYAIIKIASCSLTDWPLLERIARVERPIIASTAGASLESIDNVVSFFRHRGKQLCLMHCVGEYPTGRKNLQLNQINLLKRRYPEIPVGYSTHESPDDTDAIKIAVGKGASVFEKHVALKTPKYGINAYSATPENVRAWLEAAQEAFDMCGLEGQRYAGSEKERFDLRGLQRGVFVKRQLNAQEKVDGSCVFYAIPNFEGQLVANDMSKYSEMIAGVDLPANQAVMKKDVKVVNLRAKVLQIVEQVRNLLVDSKIVLPNSLEIELSHHYGIENFENWGATIINCINREYCKKLIILLPGQKHPSHYHRKKEETFHILYGDVTLSIDGAESRYAAGDMIVVKRDAKHDFRSEAGGIFEEISTTHFKDDSFYDDECVVKNKNRKTVMTFWSDWLLNPVS